MQVVILAAGESKRLKPLTNSKPKCLLPLSDGKTILDFTLRNLIWAGLNEFVIVTGFESDQLKEHVLKHFPGLNVKWIHNDKYSTTNNSYSLWLAKDSIYGQFLLLDADIVFDRHIIQKVLDDKHKDILSVRTEGDIFAEDMKVKLDSFGLVRKISKELNIESSNGESIGIEKFSASFGTELFNELDISINYKSGANEFYELSFQAVIDKGEELFGLDISPYKCIEIDTPDDYQRAQEIIKTYFTGQE
ncbi:phosphocholine cytidylyltransferase family protein [bacterium]|nr:phosphocholine cytidylyltransferase family protein [bacterium]